MSKRVIAKRDSFACQYLSLVLCLVVLAGGSGCRIGHSSLLFATRTNVGLDTDTTPPTFELSIARDEGVISPQFEGGATLPVMASFRSRQKGPSRLLFGVSSSFATGKVAAGMAEHFGAEDQRAISYKGLVLEKKPERLGFWSWIPGVNYKVDANFPEPGEVRPLFFGTQSMFGAKVEWNGTTAQYPSGAKIGYNRSEIALVPVTMRKVGEKEYHVGTSSLLATVDSDFRSEDEGNAGMKYMQFFATGDAAEKLALRKQVREVLIKDMVNPSIKVENSLQTIQEVNRGLVLQVSNLVGKLDFSQSREEESSYKLTTAYQVGLAMRYFGSINGVSATGKLTAAQKESVKKCYEELADEKNLPLSSADTQILNAVIEIMGK